jgi:hypothetical protein
MYRQTTRPYNRQFVLNRTEIKGRTFKWDFIVQNVSHWNAKLEQF